MRFNSSSAAALLYTRYLRPFVHSRVSFHSVPTFPIHTAVPYLVSALHRGEVICVLVHLYRILLFYEHF